MRVLLLGASGFIGRSLVSKVPANLELTGTYNTNKPDFGRINIEQLDYLDVNIDWLQIVEKYQCIIVAARANSGTETEREEISKRAQSAFEQLTKAVIESEPMPFIVAVNGSLSYGHRAEELVETGDKINPTGFARSYAIAEKPFRDLLALTNKIGIIRAPWVIGSGSWFSQMYLEPDKIPIIRQGQQWMSVVSVEGLAEFVWQVVESQRSGVLHPKLIYRCRQKEFASLVKEVTKKQTHKLGRFKLMWMEKQMRESVLASIKLDDGMGNQSENQTSKMKLKSVIEEIYSGFS